MAAGPDDFTEAAYRDLIRLAKRRYRFLAFSDYRDAPPGSLLWRHDIDFSVHRALALARIEAEEGAVATYFLNLHSRFYNALEPEIAERVREFVALSHKLGLHFDPSFYAGRPKPLEEALAGERALLEDVFEAPVGAFSFHNPALEGWADERDEIAGMVNAYGSYLREHYVYRSDSHGRWREPPLADLLSAGDAERLHVLTHPEWWVPEPMSPRDRVSRCIDGRAAAQHARYDAVAAAAGRANAA